MKLFELAQRINRKGDLYISRNGTKDFHKLATDLLADSGFAKSYDFQEVVLNAFKSNISSKQNYKQLEFSDLPLTLARGKNCFIDIYFWRRRPTTIHNHHFSGAFMCLEGNNVDLEFEFKKKQKIGKYHDLGELTLREERNLKAGDIATIAPLDKFIHQNHHQAELTVNLCFRTPDIKSKNLSNYLFSGLRYEKNHDQLGRTERLRRFLDMGDFKINDSDVSSDDAISFLLQHHGTASQNLKLQKLLKIFDKRMQNEFGVNIPKMLNQHDIQFEKLENDYE